MGGAIFRYNFTYIFSRCCLNLPNITRRNRDVTRYKDAQAGAGSGPESGLFIGFSSNFRLELGRDRAGDVAAQAWTCSAVRSWS